MPGRRYSRAPHQLPPSASVIVPASLAPLPVSPNSTWSGTVAPLSVLWSEPVTTGATRMLWVFSVMIFSLDVKVTTAPLIDATVR